MALLQSGGFSEKQVGILLVSPFAEDHRSLAQIVAHSNWTLDACHDRAEALRILGERPISVIICERKLPDGDWKDLLAETRSLQIPPVVIVTARLADESLWAEVLDLHGFDVLAKPFASGEVLRIVALAWRHWRDGPPRAEQILYATAAAS
jgi:DNA-binding response OmpR family regulator